MTKSNVNNANRKTQTCGCGNRKAQPSAEASTWQQERKENTAKAQSSKVAATDAGTQRTLTGGRFNRARHNRPKSKPIKDSIIGVHHIPVIEAQNFMELATTETSMLMAITDIQSNPDKACGVDRKSVEQTCEEYYSVENRKKLRDQLLKGTYKPDAVRTVQIPKPNGKKRTLGIATVRDRLVQRMLLNTAEYLLPASCWSEYSYAYQKNKSVADAIAEINRIRKEGFKFAIKLDLSSFFDNVPHDRLTAKLKQHIADERAVRLINSFLTQEMRDNKGNRWINRKGSPQGSILSPWLASKLYLDELDKELRKRNLRFVRYADDITVFCHSRQAAKRIKQRLIKFVETVLQCPVNHEKTEIVEINQLAVLGVVLKKGRWIIDPKKAKEYCGEFRCGMKTFLRTGDSRFFEEARVSFVSKIKYYKRIPGINKRKIEAMQRWASRVVRQTLCAIPPERKVNSTKE